MSAKIYDLHFSYDAVENFFRKHTAVVSRVLNFYELEFDHVVKIFMYNQKKWYRFKKLVFAINRLMKNPDFANNEELLNKNIVAHVEHFKKIYK